MEGITDITTNPDQEVNVGARVVELVVTILTECCPPSTVLCTNTASPILAWPRSLSVVSQGITCRAWLTDLVSSNPACSIAAIPADISLCLSEGESAPGETNLENQKTMRKE